VQQIKLANHNHRWHVGMTNMVWHNIMTNMVREPTPPPTCSTVPVSRRSTANKHGMACYYDKHGMACSSYKTD
jgi:hypothetical protein